MQFYQVQFRAVTFVLAKAILGIASAKVAHNRVARHLRDHARGGDAEAKTIAVDEDVLGLKSEAGKGNPHRLVGRTQNIDRVDFD